MEDSSRNIVSVRAYSPDSRPILVLELGPGGLRTAYYEAGYDLNRTKRVSEEWLRDNAVARHSFVEVSPPRRLEAGDLRDYVESELVSN